MSEPKKRRLFYFTPEQEKQFNLVTVPGTNVNSNVTVGGTARKTGVQALNFLAQESARKDAEIESRSDRKTVKRLTTVGERLRGDNGYSSYMSGGTGMSGRDPLLGTIFDWTVGAKGIDALGKTALWNFAKYGPSNLFRGLARNYFINNAFKLELRKPILFGLSKDAIESAYVSSVPKPSDTGLTSLKFFERKSSKLNEDEKLGIPKGDRNNKKSINPDNVYGNLRFIRVIDGLPDMKNGLVQLGNPNKLLANFTTDLPFRLHSWYPNIPGPTYMVVSPRAFKGKKFYSIKPSDSFLSTVDSKVTPNQIRIISGDPKILAEAERRGMRTLTSDELQDLFNTGSEITKKEFELGRNGAVRPFANADVAIDDFKFRNRFYKEDVPEILFKYPEGVVTPYRAEIDRLITQNIGRPSIKDYLVLENMTGLDAGITSKFDSEFIKKAKDPLANKDMFEKVYYPVTSQIEEELMNSIGLYSGPHYSFSNLLKLGKLKGNPLKEKQGGKITINNADI